MSTQDDSLELDPRKIKALGHPVRQRIVKLFERGAVKSVAATDLAAALSFYFQDVKPKDVAYHVAVLQRADLIPVA